ncbi:MAG: nucleoside deaminase [Magnetococcales bacterium]|nr:nucleoside deaminase [Magnetococcales bacterium]
MSDWLSAEGAAALLALVGAAEAGARDEVPVGAVLTDALGRILGVCGNLCVSNADPVGHAEMRVMRQVARCLDNYRLTATRMAVSLEPCPMCREAASLARVDQIRFAARREGGFAEVVDPFLAQDAEYGASSVALLQFFFSERRADLNSSGKSV